MWIPPYCTLAIVFLGLYHPSWWAGLSEGIANAAFVAVMAVAAIAGYWALLRSSRFILERGRLVCPECGQSLLGSDGGTTVQTTGCCPSCGSQVIEPESDGAAHEMALARSRRAAVRAAPRARYSPVHEWRGFLVIVAWIVSPLRWVVFNVAPMECTTVNSLGVGRVRYTIALFWSLFAPGLIASAAWLAWHWRRAQTASAR